MRPYHVFICNFHHWPSDTVVSFSIASMGYLTPLLSTYKSFPKKEKVTTCDISGWLRSLYFVYSLQNGVFVSWQPVQTNPSFNPTKHTQALNPWTQLIFHLVQCCVILAILLHYSLNNPVGQTYLTFSLCTRNCIERRSLLSCLSEVSNLKS